MTRVSIGCVATVLAALIAAGCGSDEARPATTDPGYVAGDGLLDLVPVDERSEPVVLTGPTVDGGTVDTSGFLGQVVVVNLWYADCPPCRVEAEDLQAASEELADDGVEFLGINVRDTAERAAVYEKQFGITYPSLLDKQNDSSAVLALRGEVSPNAVPSTLVLDAQGRIAARVSGIVTRTTLVGLVEDELARK